MDIVCFCIQIKIYDLSTTSSRGVFGVTCLQDRVFIATHAKEIDVYLKSEAGYIKLPGISNARLQSMSDLAACSRNRRLYVSDFVDYGIWMIEKPELNEAQFKRFASVKKAQGLSVTVDGCVIVVTGLPYSLFVFMSDGSQQKYIDLTARGIEDP